MSTGKDAERHDTGTCTTQDHPDPDCLTTEETLTGPGIDGDITTWRSYRPSTGRLAHLDASAALTAGGLATLITTLQALHRALIR